MLEKKETPYRAAGDVLTGHFKEGPGFYAWRPRGVADWLLIYTVRGKGRLGYGKGARVEGEIIAEAGDMTLLRPGTLHDHGVEPTLQRWELLWAHFQPPPAWYDLLAWPAARDGWPGLMRLRLSESELRQRIVRRFMQVHQLATGAMRHRIHFARNALEEVLLWCDACNPRHSGLIDPRIQQSMDGVCADLRRPADVPRMAELAGLSESRFAHLFRRGAGMSPQRWVEMQRLNRARQLLQTTNLSIKQIAGEVGYDNPLYFSLRFARQHGQSPRSFRRQGDTAVTRES